LAGTIGRTWGFRAEIAEVAEVAEVAEIKEISKMGACHQSGEVWLFKSSIIVDPLSTRNH
jgi:hypothetical protein